MDMCIQAPTAQHLGQQHTHMVLPLSWTVVYVETYYDFVVTLSIQTYSAWVVYSSWTFTDGRVALNVWWSRMLSSQQLSCVVFWSVDPVIFSGENVMASMQYVCIEQWTWMLLLFTLCILAVIFLIIIVHCYLLAVVYLRGALGDNLPFGWTIIHVLQFFLIQNVKI